MFLKQKFGYTDDQIRPYAFSVAPFLADPKAIQQGYLTSEPFTIEKQGVKPVVMLLADAGYTQLWRADPDLRQAGAARSPTSCSALSMPASRAGTAIFMAIPAPANALIKRDNPEMTDALLAYGIAKIKEYGIVDSGDAKTDGIGAMTEARWRDFFETMAKAGVYPADLDFRKAFTLQFVNKKVGMDREKADDAALIGATRGNDPSPGRSRLPATASSSARSGRCG